MCTSGFFANAAACDPGEKKQIPNKKCGRPQPVDVNATVQDVEVAKEFLSKNVAVLAPMEKSYMMPYLLATTVFRNRNYTRDFVDGIAQRFAACRMGKCVAPLSAEKAILNGTDAKAKALIRAWRAANWADIELYNFVRKLAAERYQRSLETLV